MAAADRKTPPPAGMRSRLSLIAEDMEKKIDGIMRNLNKPPQFDDVAPLKPSPPARAPSVVSASVVRARCGRAKMDTCLRFGGAGYAEIPGSASLEASMDSLQVDFWINTTHSDKMTVFDCRLDSAQYTCMVLNGAVSLLYEESVERGACGSIATSTHAVDTGGWRFVQAQWQPCFILKIDGVQQQLSLDQYTPQVAWSRNTRGNEVCVLGCSLPIPSRSRPLTNPFTGDLCEVRIRGNSQGKGVLLVARYACDEGAGTVLKNAVKAPNSDARIHNVGWVTGEMARLPGTVLAFAGMSYLTAGTLGLGKDLHSLRISVWMCTRCENVMTLFGVTDSQRRHQQVRFTLNGNELGEPERGSHVFTLRDAEGREVHAALVGMLCDGRWHHISWGYEHGEVSLAINGNPVDVDTKMPQDDPPSDFVKFMDFLAIGANNHRGMISDCYTGILAGAKVEANGAVLAEWEFDDGPGGTLLTDTTRNANHAVHRTVRGKTELTRDVSCAGWAIAQKQSFASNVRPYGTAAQNGSSPPPQQSAPETSAVKVDVALLDRHSAVWYPLPSPGMLKEDVRGLGRIVLQAETRRRKSSVAAGARMPGGSPNLSPRHSRLTTTGLPYHTTSRLSVSARAAIETSRRLSSGRYSELSAALKDVGLNPAQRSLKHALRQLVLKGGADVAAHECLQGISDIEGIRSTTSAAVTWLADSAAAGHFTTEPVPVLTPGHKYVDPKPPSVWDVIADLKSWESPIDQHYWPPTVVDHLTQRAKAKLRLAAAKEAAGTQGHATKATDDEVVVPLYAMTYAMLEEVAWAMWNGSDWEAVASWQLLEEELQAQGALRRVPNVAAREIQQKLETPSFQDLHVREMAAGSPSRLVSPVSAPGTAGSPISAPGAASPLSVTPKHGMSPVTHMDIEPTEVVITPPNAAGAGKAESLRRAMMDKQPSDMSDAPPSSSVPGSQEGMRYFVNEELNVHVVQYRNPHATNPESVQPDSVVWLGKPPYSSACLSVPSEVLEAVYAHPPWEAWEGVTPGGRKWAVTPPADKAVLALVTQCRGAQNPNCVDPIVAEAFDGILEDGIPSLGIDPDTLNDFLAGQEPTPRAVQDVLSVQQLVFDERTYYITLTGVPMIYDCGTMTSQRIWRVALRMSRQLQEEINYAYCARACDINEATVVISQKDGPPQCYISPDPTTHHRDREQVKVLYEQVDALRLHSDISPAASAVGRESAAASSPANAPFGENVFGGTSSPVHDEDGKEIDDGQLQVRFRSVLDSSVYAYYEHEAWTTVDTDGTETTVPTANAVFEIGGWFLPKAERFIDALSRAVRRLHVRATTGLPRPTLELCASVPPLRIFKYAKGSDFQWNDFIFASPDDTISNAVSFKSSSFKDITFASADPRRVPWIMPNRTYWTVKEAMLGAGRMMNQQLTPFQAMERKIRRVIATIDFAALPEMAREDEDSDDGVRQPAEILSQLLAVVERVLAAGRTTGEDQLRELTYGLEEIILSRKPLIRVPEGRAIARDLKFLGANGECLDRALNQVHATRKSIRKVDYMDGVMHLIDCGASREATGSGTPLSLSALPFAEDFTAMHLTAICNRRGYAKPMVEVFHLDINALDVNGKSPLHIAVEHHATDVVDELLSLGARTDIQDREGRTALHIAVLREYCTSADLFDLFKRLSDQSDLMLTDVHGLTADELAEERQLWNLANHLRQRIDAAGPVE